MALSCPVEPNLTQDAAKNATNINSYLSSGAHVRIPKGVWPVGPILLAPNSRISGCGIGVSELKFEITSPATWQDSNVVRALGPASTNVTLNDITINGNGDGTAGSVDFSNVPSADLYRAGMGVFLEGTRDSLFSNLQIKNCWSDGVFIDYYEGSGQSSSTPANSIISGISIWNCGRNGVGLQAGENLVLSNLIIFDIGQGALLQKWPRAAIDMTPKLASLNPNPSYVRNINLTGCLIRNTGQGILARGENSSEEMTDLVIADVDMLQVNGNQLLYLQDVLSFAIENFTMRDFNATVVDATEKIGGIMFEDSTGVAANLYVYGATYSSTGGQRYPVVFEGTSSVQLSNLHVEDCTYGALRVGPDPASEVVESDSASLQLSNFVFRDLMGAIGAQIIVVNSTGDVSLANGVIRSTGNAAQTVNLLEDAYFHACDFVGSGMNDNVFSFASPGKAIGSTNNWNRRTFVQLQDVVFELTRENVIHMAFANRSVNIQPSANWDGNEVLIRDVTNSANPNISVFSVLGSIFGPTTISDARGALVLRCDGSDWYSSGLPSQ